MKSPAQSNKLQPTPAIETARLRDKRETARRLNSSVPTVERLMRIGALRYVKVGNLVRFEDSAIDEYIKANTRGGAAA